MQMWIAAVLALLAATAGVSAQSLDGVRSTMFRAKDFKLESGVVLPELEIAYETYGTLAADGRNAVLITHGYTSSHHAAGRYAEGGTPEGMSTSDLGWWDKLIGPGKAIDTSRYFVVSSNMLGSSYGSTSPKSRNPATGKPYGPDFPRISVADIVRAQKAMLDGLGVKHLVAVAGPSYGGFQAFQWAVTFPDFMRGVVPVVTAPFSTTTPANTAKLIADLSADPNWNGGWYYDKGGIGTVLTRMRVATLKLYGIEAQLAARFPDPALRDAEIVKAAQPWVRTFDGHSMVILRRALEGFDLRPQFPRIKAKVLYVISRTDKLFPPSIVPGVMNALKDAGVTARYHEIDSELGHLASGTDAEKWAAALAAFMQELSPR